MVEIFARTMENSEKMCLHSFVSYLKFLIISVQAFVQKLDKDFVTHLESARKCSSTNSPPIGSLSRAASALGIPVCHVASALEPLSHLPSLATSAGTRRCICKEKMMENIVDSIKLIINLQEIMWSRGIHHLGCCEGKLLRK